MLTRPIAATVAAIFFVRNARYATNRLLGEFCPTNGGWVGKRRNFNAQNVIAIAAATALGVAAMTTSAVAGCGGGGGHGGGSGGRFAGGGGHYGGCSDRGHGRGLGAGIVGICAVGNSVHRSAARCARHRAAV